MRYYVNYAGSPDDELQHLPTVGRHIEDMLPLNLKRKGNLRTTDIGIDSVRKWVDIDLTKAQAESARLAGLTVSEKGDERGAPLFDPDGTVFGQQYCNEYSKVEYVNNPYPGAPPNRRDYMTGTATPFSQVFEWNKNNSRGTFIDGTSEKVVQSAFEHVGIPLLWAQGFTGAGKKIGLIDIGATTDNGHPDVPVTAYYDTVANEGAQTNDTHTWGRVSQLAANSKLRGVCPGASVYVASLDSIPLAFSWLISQGVDVINCSFANTPSDYTVALIKEYTANGGIVVVAGGNQPVDSPPTTINPLAAVGGVVAVGAYAGGSIYKFFETIYYKSNQPVNGKGLTVLAPNTSVDAATKNTPDDPNLYQSGTRGTSMAAPIVTGLLLLMKQKYPTVKNSATLVKLLTMTAKQSTDGYLLASAENLK